MATWQQVRELLQKEYPIKEDKGEFLMINFKISETRTQIVGVNKRESSGAGDWVEIMSPIGDVPPVLLDKVLAKAYEMVFGGIVKCSDLHFLRDTLPLEDLTPDRLVQTLHAIVGKADSIEKECLGTDKF